MCQQHLTPDTILAQEFDYAAQTAFQAQEDRVKVFNYYLATLASAAAALLVEKTTGDRYLLPLAIFFIMLALLGLLSLLQLIKLRLAWTDSVRTMCRIKDYYLTACPESDLQAAFRWRTETIPRTDKKWSLAFLMALTIMLLSSLSAGIAWHLARAANGQSLMRLTWADAAIFGVVFLAQIILWQRLLRPAHS